MCLETNIYWRIDSFATSSVLSFSDQPGSLKKCSSSGRTQDYVCVSLSLCDAEGQNWTEGMEWVWMWATCFVTSSFLRSPTNPNQLCKPPPASQPASITRDSWGAPVHCYHIASIGHNQQHIFSAGGWHWLWSSGGGGLLQRSLQYRTDIRNGRLNFHYNFLPWHCRISLQIGHFISLIVRLLLLLCVWVYALCVSLIDWQAGRQHVNDYKNIVQFILSIWDQSCPVNFSVRLHHHAGHFHPICWCVRIGLVKSSFTRRERWSDVYS